jgi:uncharacterized membrane protein YbhN (UPF0104 family)
MLTSSPATSSETTRPALRPPSGTPGFAGTDDPRVPAETPFAEDSLWRRVLRPQTLISFAFALAVLWFVVRRLNVDPAAVWSQVRQANPLLLAIAFALWYGAFLVRGWRWGRMIEIAGLAEAEREIPRTRGLAEIVLLAYFANSLVPAKLGDAYRGYLLKRESGVPLSAGFGTILAERLVDAMMLVVVLAGSALLLFGRSVPEQATPAFTLGALVIGGGVLGLGGMWLTRDTVGRFLPDRIQDIYARLHGAVFGSLRRPSLVIGVSLLLWFGDGMRVWFVARSLDAGISPLVAILVAVMGALLTIVPFTPAGLGVVELGVGSVLVGVLGVDPVVAGSIILLDRVVAYWSLLLVGSVLYVRRARREFREQGEVATASPRL